MKTWDPKIDDTKSKRDHCIGVKKGSKKSKKYLRVAKAVTKMSRKKASKLNLSNTNFPKL